MFDLNINKAILERHNIKRWNNDGSINRDYIRENLTNGDFINKYYKNLEEDYNKNKCYIFKCRTELIKQISETDFYNLKFNYNLGSIFSDKYININDGTFYIILPFIDKNVDNIKIIWDYISYDLSGNQEVKEDSVILTQYTYLTIFHYLVESPYVIDAYICSNNFSNNLLTYIGITNEENKDFEVYRLRDGENDLLSQNVYNFDYYTSDTAYIRIPVLKEIKCLPITYEEDYFIFRKNTNTNEKFSIELIPQLLDENYYKLNFGERLGYITYPLYTLYNSRIFFKLLYDITTGNRIITITNSNNEENNDVYLVTSINQTKETLDLFSDRFQNYMSTNKGTLSTGVALAKNNIQYEMAKNIIGVVKDDKTLYEKIGSIGGNIVDSLVDLYNINKKLQITKENALYSPDITKLGNTFTSDLMALSLNVFEKVDVVNDIEYVAKKYEQYGYLVNKEVIDVNLYEDFNTRLYYNIVKFNNIDIELNYINNQTLIQNIIARLENGLRLWNIASINIDDDKINYNYFNYDNVENDFI